MKTVSAADGPAFALSQVRFKDVLNIEELEIDPCQVSAVVGPSGGGKTTLLRILNRMTTPDSGRVLFFGESVEDIDPVELRRRVIILTQMPLP